MRLSLKERKFIFYRHFHCRRRRPCLRSLITTRGHAMLTWLSWSLTFCGISIGHWETTLTRYTKSHIWGKAYSSRNICPRYGCHSLSNMSLRMPSFWWSKPPVGYLLIYLWRPETVLCGTLLLIAFIDHTCHLNFRFSAINCKLI